MSDDTDYIERTEDLPPAARRAERRMIRNGLGWWLAALAVVIAAGAAFVLTASPVRETSVDTARDVDLAQASLDNATTDAQLAALKASRSAQQAIAQSAAATDVAAETAAATTALVVDAAAQQAENSAAVTLDSALP